MSLEVRRRSARALRFLRNFTLTHRIVVYAAALLLLVTLSVITLHSFNNWREDHHESKFDHHELLKSDEAAHLQLAASQAMLRASELQHDVDVQRRNSETLEALIVAQKKLDPAERQNLSKSMEEFNREEAATHRPVPLDERLARIRANNRRLLAR